MSRVLVIDDDIELCELLGEYLTPEGFELESVNDGKAGVEVALSGAPSLVVLDVMLPEMNGFEVLRRIREHSKIPVIMLTARGDDVDRIVGLEMGADDYLPKPFNPRELVARIRAIQRRAETPAAKETPGTAPSERLVLGDIVLNVGSRTVKQRGREVDLTSVEFSLLEMLLRQAGQIVSREDLVRSVLGRRLSPYDRSLDVHISSLRKKLGHQVGEMERIKTVRGIGYQYALSAETGEQSG